MPVFLIKPKKKGENWIQIFAKSSTMSKQIDLLGSP